MDEADSSSPFCASCGIAEIDDVELTECAACDLVRYCSDVCQRDHKSQHEEDCKIRAAELRDELLFKQPESTNRGDCPICCLPLPLVYSIYGCCSKQICIGCTYYIIGEAKASLKLSCPFCREPVPNTDEEIDKQKMKRIEANDPVAIRQEGTIQYMKGDYSKAFERYTNAAQLGNADAHYKLAKMYNNKGHGVEKDMGKALYHLEEAAIGGHPTARFNLGVHELHNGNVDRAVKHFVISATQGDDESIKRLMDTFKRGGISKDDLTSTLRAYQAAEEATKSPQREAAEKYYQNQNNSGC